MPRFWSKYRTSSLARTEARWMGQDKPLVSGPDSRYTPEQQAQISRGDTLQQCPHCKVISSFGLHRPDCESPA